MLTPIEIHNAEHKTGRGYSKKEMDEFLEDVSESYEAVYKENMELKNKLSKLSNEIEYYKSMETTLQKALVLAEKTSKDTIDTAKKEAGVIEKQASIKAEKIVNQAWSQYDVTRQKCMQLIQQYNQFKMQFKQIAIKQIDLLESDFYEIYSSDLTASLNEAIDKADSEPAKADDSISEETGTGADNTGNIADESLFEEEYAENQPAAESEQVDETKVVEVKADETKKVEIKEVEVKEAETEENELKEAEVKENKANEDIPAVDLESIDSLLRDIKQDFADRQEKLNNGDTKFEFLDNE